MKKNLAWISSSILVLILAIGLYGCGDDATDEDDETTLPTLAAADLNTTSPCPDQALLTDATFITNLKAATGLSFYYNAGFATNDERCNRGSGFVAASTQTEVNVGDFTAFLLGTAGADDGVLHYGAGGCGTNEAASDSLPKAGIYRWDGKFTANGKTYRMRVRVTISGDSAGATLASLGVTNLETTLKYKVGADTLTPDATMFTTLAGKLPSFTVSVTKNDDTALISALVEVICAKEV